MATTHTKTKTFLKTGIEKYDHVITGFEPGLHFIGSRLGMGKSVLLATMARNIAQQGKRVFVASHDMHIYNMKDYIWGIDDNDRNSGEYEEPDWIKNVIIGNDEGTILRVIEENEKQPLSAVFIDDLFRYAIINQIGQEAIYQTMNRINFALLGATKELNIPVITFIQLNREVDKELYKRPTLRHIKPANSIEEMAQTITLLYRAEYYKNQDYKGFDENVDGTPCEGKIELIVANRRGRIPEEIKIPHTVVQNFDANKKRIW